MAVLHDDELCSSTTGIISCVEYGPCYQQSCLLATGISDNRLCVKRAVIDDSKIANVENIVQAMKHESLLDMPVNMSVNKIRSIAWSPSSALSEFNTDFRLAVLSGSNNIALISCSDSDISGTEIDIHHKSHINDVAFSYVDEQILASVGDDSRVVISNISEAVTLSSYTLLSPGVSVCTNPSEPQQIMVVEKCGRIRFYHLSEKQPIRTIECFPSPLIQADWSLVNGTKVGAVAGNNWLWWDIRHSSLPVAVGVAHSTSAIGFKWCNVADNLYSTLSSSGQFKVHYYGHKKNPVTHDALILSGMSWHPNLPVVAVGDTTNIKLWSVET